MENTHIDLQFRIRTMMATPEAKRPTSRFMTELERTLLDELKAISADENVLSVGQDQGMVNSVNVDKVNQGPASREEKPPKRQFRRTNTQGQF